MEKEIEIEWNGKKEKVTIKRLTFGERNKFMEEFIKVRMVGDTFQTEVLHGQMKTLALLRCIVKAPFPIDIASIESLDADLGDYLYSEIDKFNRLSEIKKSS